MDLAEIVQQADEAVLVTDKEGTIRYVNHAFEELTGYAMKEIVGKNPRLLKSGKHPAEFYETMWTTILAGSVFRAVCINRRKDGTLFHEAQSIHPIRDPDGNVCRFVSIGHDASRRVAAEEEVRKSESRFRSLIENSYDGITLLAEDGTILYDSPAISRILGYAPGERLGHKPWEYMHPDDAASTRHSFRDVCRRPRAVNHSKPRFRHRDGSLRWIEATRTNLLSDACVQAIVVNYRDMTEHHQREQSLGLFRNLIDRSHDAFAVVDPDTGCILDISERYVLQSGYSREELLASHVWDLAAGMTQEDFHGIVARVRDAGTLVTEGSDRRKDGSTFPVEVSMNYVMLDRGYLVTMLRDMTERKQAEDMLQSTEKQLRHAIKMEVVGRLAGGIAHDFNNLLTTIIGYAQLLARKLKPREVLFEYVQEVNKAGERAASLVKQLLAFSRPEAAHARPLDLNEVIRDVEKMLGRLIGEDIAVKLHLDEGLGLVRADPGHMQQVLMNLVVNARDAMPDGGELIIATANREPGAAGEPPGRAPRAGPYVMLSVSDTGCGMLEQVRSQIFEPFFTTKEPSRGTGLGLSIVYGIVTHCDGCIEVSSQPGQGSTFRVYLPRHSSAHAAAEAGRGESVLSGAETILLVEDDAALRTVAGEVLRDAGYRVVDACCGPEALKLMEEGRMPIQMLLTDVVMPQMSGRQLANRFLECYPRGKVLFMSGYDEESIAGRAVEFGKTTFLRKPFSPSGLTQRVRQVLDS